jgi:hypothetical protein
MATSAANKYRVADKYLRIAANLDHSADGDIDAIRRDEERVHNEWKSSRARANSTAENNED